MRLRSLAPILLVAACQPPEPAEDILILRDYKLVHTDGTVELLSGAPDENAREHRSTYDLEDFSGRTIARVSETLWTLSFDQVRGIVRHVVLEPAATPVTLWLDLFEQPDPLTRESLDALRPHGLPSGIRSGPPDARDHLLHDFGRTASTFGLHPEGYQLAVWSRPPNVTRAQEHPQLGGIPQVTLEEPVTLELAVVVAREWKADTEDRLLREVDRTRP